MDSDRRNMESGKLFILEASQFNNTRMQWVASCCQLMNLKFRFNLFEALGNFKGQLIVQGNRVFPLADIRRVFFMFDVTLTEEFEVAWNCEIQGMNDDGSIEVVAD